MRNITDALPKKIFDPELVGILKLLTELQKEQIQNLLIDDFNDELAKYLK